MKYIKLLLILFIASTATVNGSYAQGVLTLNDAKNIALNNNYQVKLSENQVLIASTRTHLLEVGHKPTLGISSSINGNLNNTSLKYYGFDDPTTTWAAPSLDASLGASASYKLWDAHKVNNLVSQSKEEESLSKISLNATREEIVYRVESAYLNVARLNENRTLFEASITISQKRKVRAQYAYEYGSGDKLALLNAEVDLNRDSVNLLKFNQQYVNIKRNLNLILNRDIHIEYDIDTNQEIDYSNTLDQFYSTALDHNLQLQQANQSLIITNYEKIINDSNLKPFVSANASYGVNYRDNTDVNPLDYSLGDALKVGISANWNISDGGRTKQLNQLAALQLNAQELLVHQIKDQIWLEITNAWGEYQNALLVFHLEEKNLVTANENFIRTEEKFKNGQINSITFRQAQLNYLLAELNLSSAKFDAMLVLLDLKQLSGVLL